MIEEVGASTTAGNNEAVVEPDVVESGKKTLFTRIWNQITNTYTYFPISETLVQSAPPPAVDEQETANMVEPAVIAQPSPVVQKQNKKKGGKNKAHSNINNNVEASAQGMNSDLPQKPADLIATVKRTPFDDSEAQQLIDILLNKQSGVPVEEDRWIEPGQKADSKEQQLERQLAERDTELAHEKASLKSVTERLNVLRQELNASKTAQVHFDENL